MSMFPGASDVTGADERASRVSMVARPTAGQLPLLLAAGFTLLVVTDALCTVLDLRPLEGVRRQIDITQEGNLAAWFSGSVLGIIALVSARLAWLAWRRHRHAVSASAWLAVACAFGFYGVTTAVALHDHAARAYLLRLRPESFRASGNSAADLFSLEAFGALSLLLLGGFILTAVRGNRRAWLLAILGVVLMTASPVAERYENRLISNPHNYVFVANDQPYRFSHTAADRLWIASHIKEGVETAGAIALLAGLLAYYETVTTAVAERGAARRRRISSRTRASDLTP
jgi:hypothetical protein